MKETAKQRRLNAFFRKALSVFAAALILLCNSPRIVYAASKLPMGSEADGYYIDADGNMTIYTDAGLENWLDDIGGGPRTYKMLVKTLTVNEGVTVIEELGSYGSASDMPFSQDCDNLTTVSLPASLTEIGDKSFQGCDKLTTVTIAEPSNLTTIGASAFDFDTSLTTINIPAGVTTIGSGAFKDCRALELDAATLPSGLTAINDSIFANCWKMTGSLTIPDGVTSIGDNAFDNCRALESVTIPASVRSIGSDAFYGCVLTSVTIPDGVTSIGASAFYYCYKLRSVTISASVRSIGTSAFERCDTLNSVTMLGETPPTLGDGGGSDNVFKDSGISTIDKQIYVPKSSINTYKNSWTQWKDYINDAGYAGSIDPTTEDYADTDIDVLGFTEDATVYSVDVEWGAMTFQWENSSWNPETHMKKVGAEWKVYDSANNKALDEKEDKINEIKVTNHSNANVYATLDYKSGAAYDPDTTGAFGYDTGITEDAADAAALKAKLTEASGDVPAYLTLETADNNEGDGDGVGKETIGKAYFMPSGLAAQFKKGDGIDKWAKIGIITVGIKTEEP